MPDLTTLEPRKPLRLRLIAGSIVAIVALLLLSAWAGFAMFQPSRELRGQGFAMTIEGPSHLTLGEETVFFLNWQNPTSEPIAHAAIRVNVPREMTLVACDPPPTEKQELRWNLGSIPPGGRGTMKLKGIASGALGTATAIQAIGQYRPASLNSEFEALATKAIEYRASVLEGTLALPQKSLPGDLVRVIYTLTHRGRVALNRLEARLTMPPGFMREASSSTSSAFNERVARFVIGDLAPGASTSVSLFGAFSAGHAGETAFSAETGRVDADGSFLPSQKAENATLVLSGDLALKLLVDGSDAHRSIEVGKLMHVTLNYENTATEPIQGVVLRLIVDPLAASSTSGGAIKSAPPFSPIEWSQFENSTSGTVRRNMIEWNPNALGIFKRLSSGQEGTIELALPTISDMQASRIGAFQLLAEATMKSVGNTVVNRTITTAPIVFRFHTDAHLTSEARYFSEEGAPLGIGPLPPIVGQSTRYRIEWRLAKTLHELKHIRVSAAVPKRVAWPQKITVSAGELAYDDSNRTVTWTLNRMPKEISEVYANFDLDLTPSEVDVGRFAPLLGETTLELQDADIDETIRRVQPPLTTDLQNDDGAKSKGVVRKS